MHNLPNAAVVCAQSVHVVQDRVWEQGEEVQDSEQSLVLVLVRVWVRVLSWFWQLAAAGTFGLTTSPP